MSVLSSFINYKTKRKGKNVAKSPFSIRRLDSASSPHPYASPDVLDINDKSLHALEYSDPGNAEGSSGHPAGQTSYSPQVKLDIDISREPLADWFSSGFLQTEPFAMSLEGVSAGASGSGDRSALVHNDLQAALRARPEEISEEDEDVSTSSEDVLANLEAMDASAFVNLSPFPNSSTQMQDQILSSPMKKYPPSPIKIPSALSPQLQVLRSGDGSFTYGPSRPQSMVSSPASSAISGTTLARALMANTFILSSDTRSSRYRSGFSTLTRSDSATLPRGEHPFITSPNWRGSGVDSLSPGFGDVPPIPPNAELLYVPPKTPRLSGSERRRVNLRRRSSTGSLSPGPEPSPDIPPHPRTPIRSRSNSISGIPADDDDFLERRRISRISEAASSAPPTPEITQKGAEMAVTIRAARVSPTPSPTRLTPNPPPSIALPPLPHAHPESSPSDQELDPEFPQSPDSNSSYPTSPEANNLMSPSLSTSSDPSSPKDIGEVLDYYSFSSDVPGPGERNYRPAFSPISEESSSQLTPPSSTPFNRRDSQRNQPLGARARSPLSPGLGGWTVTRKASDPRPYSRNLLPIGERPLSIQLSPTSSTPSTAASIYSTTPSTITSPDPRDTLAPPPLSKIFNRQRSGSAPSPIKVVRDSKDVTAYNLTVTPLPESSAGSNTPSTGNSDNVAEQTFPETPSGFSPMLSPGSAPTPDVYQGSSTTQYVIAPPMPSLPMSAALPGRGPQQPSLAQQILLTRAATSVHGARHSRSGSMSRARMPSSSPLAASHNTEEATISEDKATDFHPQSYSIEELPEEEASAQPEEHHDLSAIASVPAVPQENGVPSESPNGVAYASASTPPLNPSSGSLSVDGASGPTHNLSAPGGSRPPSRAGSSVQASDASSVISNISRTSSKRSLPPLPPSPSPSRSSDSSGPKKAARGPRTRPPVLQLDNISSSRSTPEAASRNRAPSPVIINSEPSPILPVHSVIPTSLPMHSAIATPPPVMITPPPMQPPSHSQQTPPLPESPPPPAELSPPSAELPPPPMLPPPPHFNAHHQRTMSTGEFSSLGSPPPYYTVVDVAHSNGSFTPNSGDSGARFGPTPLPPTPAGSSRSDQMSIGQESTSANRRPRTRPPLPAGPRRPSQQHGASPIAAGRARNASVSSIGSNRPQPAARRANPIVMVSPKFKSPPTKWRGYTMEAAKWTFSSTQLQNIVSRAIKQSSEASSIRLLRLETLDNDLPEEMRRLEKQRTSAKTDYKALTRKRGRLLETLSGHLEGSAERVDTTVAFRLVEELKEISVSLDGLAEDLHCFNEQIAQLENLKQIHSASALSMALRKLNASFLKQLAENEVMRQRVESLEAERDEAWQQAEGVAGDFEKYLTERVDTPSSEIGKRSSRVLAVRKSSIRASKAGLRSSTGRLSQRSSVASNSQRFSGINVPSSAKSSFYVEDAPPVPPIPRRRPMDIRTDLTSRSSGGLSTDMVTPTSEVRALVQAQEELYRMLGISIPEPKMRRSRSVIGSPSPNSAQSTTLSPALRPRDPSSPGRPLSLPGSSTFEEAHNAMTVDRNAMLATFGMLSDD